MNELYESYPLPNHPQDIKRRISDVLRRKNSQNDKVITTKLWECSLEKRGQPLQLTINSDKHINVYSSTYITSFRKPDISGFVKIANQVTLQCFSLAESYLSQPDISYDDAHIHQLIDTVYSAVDKSQTKETRFTFSNDYRLDLILQVCGYAFHVFTEKQQENIRKHLVNYLSSLQNTFRETFKASYNQIEDEKVAAICLTEFVIKQLHSSLQDKLALALVNDLKSNNVIFSNKKALKGTILLSLLDKQDFELYKVYLKDICRSYLHWITVYIQQHCKEYTEGLPLIDKLAKKELDKLTRAVIAAAENAKSCSTKVKDWLASFHSELSEVLPLNKQELYDIVEVNDDGDLSFFHEQFLDKMKTHCQNYLESHCEVLNMSNWTSIVKPAEIIRDEIEGCCEQCPFCKEQCEGRLNHKEDHFCSMHRQLCVGGWRYKYSREMTVGICTNLVATDNSHFHVYHDSDDTVLFKDYRSVYKDWSIPGEILRPSPYWKWFVVMYQDKLVEFYDYKPVTLDPDWIGLTVEDARCDVKTRYQLQ